jgi:hypothetical protein
MVEWMYKYTFFLTSALVGGEWSTSRPGRFTPGTHWIGGWVDPRAGLDDMEKTKFLTPPGLELRPFGRPASSQSLYRLSYPVSRHGMVHDRLAQGKFYYLYMHLLSCGQVVRRSSWAPHEMCHKILKLTSSSGNT